MVNQKTYKLPIIVFATIIHVVLSISVWGNTREVIQNQSQEKFYNSTSEFTDNLALKLRSYINIGYANRGLLTSFPKLSFEEWDRFNSSLTLVEDYPAIKEIQYIKFLENKLEFDSNINSIYNQNYQQSLVKELNTKLDNIRYPINLILYQYPDSITNVDIIENKIELEDLEKARSLGSFVASNEYEISEKSYSIYNVYIPVYQKNINIQSSTYRDAHIEGYIKLILDFNTIIEQSMNVQFNSYNLNVLDNEINASIFSNNAIQNTSLSRNLDFNLGDRTLNIKMNSNINSVIPERFVNNVDIFFGFVIVTGILTSLSFYYSTLKIRTLYK